jgi:hypothetical protein
MSCDEGARGCSRALAHPLPADFSHGRLMLNPLRSEGDAFRLLLYVIAVFGTIIAIILIARAL